MTLVCVSHDRDLALAIADRVGILIDGKLIFLGPPSALKDPKDPAMRFRRGVTLSMLSSLDCARSGEASATASAARDRTPRIRMVNPGMG